MSIVSRACGTFGIAGIDKYSRSKRSCKTAYAEIPVEFTYINQKKMILNMKKSSYINQKRYNNLFRLIFPT